MRVQKDWTRWTNIKLFLRRVSDGDLSFQSLLFPKDFKGTCVACLGKVRQHKCEFILFYYPHPPICGVKFYFIGQYSS